MRGSGRECAMFAIIACHNCKKTKHKKKDFNQLNKRSDKSGNLKNNKKKGCTYNCSNMVTETSIMISSSRRQSPEILIIIKNMVQSSQTVSSHMTNVTTKRERKNVRKVLLRTVVVKNVKRSLRTVP